MKNNCSRCGGDDPSCYVCKDREEAEDLAQMNYAFEMHEMCCNHLKLDSDNSAEGDTLLEAICKLEKDRDEWREEADMREKKLDSEIERLRDARAKAENDAVMESLKVALLEQDFDTIRSIIIKGGYAADVLKFLNTQMA